MSPDDVKEHADFAVVTVIPPEFEAVTKALNLGSLPVDHKDGRLYRYGEIQSTQSGHSYSCVAAQCLDRGNIAAGQLTSDIIARWKPTCLLVVGIAGGVKGRDKIALGDVVVHDDLEYYSLEKESDGKVLPRKIQLWPPSPALLSVCQAVGEKKWYEKITTPRPDGQSKSVSKLVRGQILSGETLLGDPTSDKLSKILKQFDKGVAVEMESAGVAHALWEKSSVHAAKFIVIRGISDYCNEDDNQETRTRWSPYASDAAACAALSLIQNTVEETFAGSIYQEYAAGFVKRLERKFPKRPIQFDLTFSTGAKSGIPIDTLLEILFSEKRIILQGAAGSGKSETFGRLSNLLGQKGAVTILLNLKDWDQDDSARISSEQVFEKALNALFRVSITDLNFKMFEGFPNDKPKVLLVDALNEVYGEDTVRKIINVLSEFVRRNWPNAYVLVSDRLRARGWISDWAFAKLDDLNESEVRKQVDERFHGKEYEKLGDADKKLLQTPYFLDLALAATSKSPALKSKASAIELYFREMLRFRDESLDNLAKAGFEMYDKFHTPSFDSRLFIEIVGENTWSDLLQAGAIGQPSQGRAQFDHQLKQDYLASRHLARNDVLWTSSSFDSVTLGSNSFDALPMILEQLGSATLGDAFLNLVYDWNWTATVTCLANAEASLAKPFTTEMEVAVLALVAEKLFDPILNTRDRTARVLKSFPEGTLAEEFVSAKSLQDVLTAVEKIQSKEKWFLDWKALFRRSKESPLGEREIQMVTSPSAIQGWTASNVIKRFDLDGGDGRQLRSCYYEVEHADTKGPVRWRIVHSLGALDTEDSKRFLLEALDTDDYHWVRYGAARSLVELAARTKDDPRRQSIFAELESRVNKLQTIVLEEIAHAVFYRDAPRTWYKPASHLLLTILQAQTEAAYRQKWTKTIEEFKEWSGGQS